MKIRSILLWIESNVIFISGFFSGFYFFAVMAASLNSFSPWDELNKIGVFLSSIGVIAVVLTLIQQESFKKKELDEKILSKVKSEVDYINYIRYEINSTLDIKKKIANNLLKSFSSNNDQVKLLEGVPKLTTVKINFKDSMFISHIDNKLVININYFFENHEIIYEKIRLGRNSDSSFLDITRELLCNNYDDALKIIEELENIQKNTYQNFDFVKIDIKEMIFNKLKKIPAS